MRMLAAGELEPSGMAALMGFRLLEVNEGHAVFAIQPDERHYNGLGIAHGGWPQRFSTRLPAVPLIP